MWAMIPMFRTRSRAMPLLVSIAMPATVRAAACPRQRTRGGGAGEPGGSTAGHRSFSDAPLPPVVREGLVGLCHPVDVVLALPGPALLVERVQDLGRELLDHALLAPAAREVHQPAHCECARAALRHLDGHLVVRAADPAALDLEHGRDGFDGLLQHLDRRLAGLLADPLERAVDDLLRSRLLAGRHHLVDHLRDKGRVVNGIRLDRPGLDIGTTGHYEPFLAPYLERPCLRSLTPAVSSAARMTLYRTRGRSLTRPPRTRTTECSWRLWPSPGM